jgi:Acetyltransferase (GNAT) domain
MSLSAHTTVKIARCLAELEPYRAFFDAHHRYADSSLEGLCERRRWEVVAQPHVLILLRDSKPKAMIVGRLGDSALDWRVGYKKFGSTAARLFRTVKGGVLGDFSSPEECELLCDELVHSLAEGEADVARLTIPLDTQLYRTMAPSSNLLLRDHFIETVPSWRLSLPSTYDEFLKSRSGNTKSNIRQYRNRIIKRHGERIELRRYRELSTIERMMEEIEGVASKTYQRGIGVGFAMTEAIRRRLQYAAEMGWFVGYVLYLDGQPSAFWTGTTYKRTFVSEFTGFDPKLGYYHPGMFLLLRMIEDFCSENSVDTIDFGHGDADYKRKFGTEMISEATINIFAPTLEGARLAFLHNSTMLVSHLARRALGTFGATDHLKALWRKRLADRHTSRRASTGYV